MTIYTKLTIDGTQYADFPSCEIRNSTSDYNSSSSFEIAFDNDVGIYASTFSIGQEVKFWAEKDVNPATQQIFTGLIEDIRFTGRENEEKIILSGRDYTSRLQDVTVEPSVYNNQEISTIVTDLISNYVTGITTANVDVTGNIVGHINFNHVSVYDALKQLAERVNFAFWVDIDKDLHFTAKGLTSSSVTLDNTNVIRSNITETEEGMYNQVWIYGDRVLTKWQNTFTANGGSVYALDYKPHNTEIFIGGSTFPKQGGIFQLNTEAASGVQYLVDYNDKNVIFVSGTNNGDNVPISGTDTGTVNYDRSTPIVKFAQNRTSVDTYGAKVKIINDKSIKDPTLARDMSKTFIAEHKDPKTQGNGYLKGVIGLTAGHTVLINLPYENINNVTYTLVEVRYLFTPENNFTEQVMNVTVSDKIRDAADTIKQMILDIKRLQAADIEVGDVFTRLETGEGAYGLRVSSWSVKSALTGSDFYVGSTSLANGSSHPNSWVGSPGSFWAGSHTITYTTEVSG